MLIVFVGDQSVDVHFPGSREGLVRAKSHRPGDDLLEVLITVRRFEANHDRTSHQTDSFAVRLVSYENPARVPVLILRIVEQSETSLGFSLTRAVVEDDEAFVWLLDVLSDQ